MKRTFSSTWDMFHCFFLVTLLRFLKFNRTTSVGPEDSCVCIHTMFSALYFYQNHISAFIYRQQNK